MPADKFDEAAPKKLRRWSLSGRVVASTYIGEVEAETEEQAVAMGFRKAHVSVCHQCSDDIQDPEVDEIYAELVDDDES